MSWGHFGSLKFVDTRKMEAAIVAIKEEIK